MSKLFVCINLMVEDVGNIVYIFNRRPIVFKKLIKCVCVHACVWGVHLCASTCVCEGVCMCRTCVSVCVYVCV